MPLNPETLHLPVLTEQVVRRVRAQAHLPPHPYEVRFPERFPYVAADHVRLTQVLLNTAFNMFPDSAAAAGKKEGETQLSAEQAPDIFNVNVEDVWQDVQKGWYIALDQWLEQPNPFIEKGQGSNVQGAIEENELQKRIEEVLT